MNYSSEQRDSLRIVAIVVGMLALTAILWPTAGKHMKGQNDGKMDLDVDGGSPQTRPMGADERVFAPASRQEAALNPAWLLDRRADQAGTRRLLDALRQAESGGNDRAVGDGGKSRGPYQVQRAYWREAVAETDAADWSYDKWVGNPDRAGYVVYLHWCKVCPAALRAGDCELLARCHRLPNAPFRADNENYWRRVRAAMGD